MPACAFLFSIVFSTKAKASYISILILVSSGRTLDERKRILEAHMVEVPNRVVRSNYQLIKNGENLKLKHMIWEAIDEGLEGLVLKV